MNKEVVRQDVVQISFDVDNNPIVKIQEELNKFKSTINEAFGKDIFSDFNKGTSSAADGLDDIKKAADDVKKANPFEDIADDAKKASKDVDKVKDTAEKLKKPLDNSDKSSQSFFKSLKKVAGVSMLKLKSGLSKISGELTTIGKKAMGAAYTGLKKIAGISFKMLAAGIGAAAAAVGGLVAKSVSAYADYEQIVGGVETLFKDNAGTVQKYANDAYKTAGLSANDYMETVTGFSASLLQSLGGDTAKAADYAHVAITDMADNANKMGTDMGSIQNAYQGFAKQNYTMLDNLKLGYGGTQEEMKRLVADAAKLDDSVDANSMSFGNIVKAIHAVQVQMDIYGTTQKEADKTISGSLASMKSAWSNLMPALIQGGDAFDQCVENLVSSAKTFGKNIMPAIKSGLKGVGKLIEELAPIIEKEFPALVDELLPSLIDATVSLVKGLIKALPNIISVIAKEIPNIVQQLWQAFKDAFGKQFPIINKLEKTFNNIVKFLQDNTGKIQKLIPILIGAFVGFKAIKVVMPLLSAIGGLFSKKGKGKGGFFDGIIDSLKKLGKTKTSTVLKGMANLAIIMIGFSAISGICLGILTIVSKFTDAGTMIKMVGILGALGLVGAALTKFAETAGKIKITTVLKGLADMAIMIAGMSVLFMLVGAVSLIPFDYGKVLGLIGIIGVLGLVGAALSVFAGIVGLIPVTTVALGLANIAIILAGMSALFLLIGAVSLIDFDYGKMLGIIGIIGVLGTVGSVLTVFAGIVGLIPIPVVLSGLANIALVLGGLTAVFAALGALSNIPGFNDLIKSGGDLLATIFNAIGKAIGSLIGGLAEGVTNSLPKIGENFAEFAKKLSGTDFTPIKEFFNALSSISGLPSTGGFFQMFTGDPYTGLQKMIPMLPELGMGVGLFFASVGKRKDFSGLSSVLNALSAVKALPSSGGFFQYFTGDPYTGLAKMVSMLPKLGMGVGLFFASAGKRKDYSGISSVLNALSSVKALPSSGGFFQYFTGDAYSGLAKMVVMLPKLGTGVKEFYKNAGNRTNFIGISALLNALSSVKAMPSSGGFFQLFTGDAYSGLSKMILLLPSLGTSVGNFFTNAGNVKDFTPITNILNALSNVGALPSSGGFFQTLAGDAYTGLCKMILLLPSLGTATKSFFANIGEANGFWRITSLFNALSSVNAMPTDGGLVQLFTGDPYDGLKAMIDILPNLGSSVARYYDETKGRTNFISLSALFNTLAGLKSVPTDGGLAQMFTGDPYDALKQMIDILPKLGSGVKSFYDSVGNITDFSKIKRLFETLGSLGDLVGNDGGIFDRMGEFFSGSKEEGMLKIASTLQQFGEATKDFFEQVNSLNLSNLNGLWKSLNNAESVSNDVSKIVSDNISDIVKKISDLPQKMGDGIKSGGKTLSDSLVSIWKDAVTAAAAPVNKLIDGANWILKELGSEKQIAKWTPYAKGTDGHKGGNALVNDGRGAELVQMPNGKTFIPQGKNVFIPNAPKGMKVLSAERTAQVMGRKSPTFRYADGTGDIDIWSYIDNAKGLVNAVADKFVSYDGLSGFALNIGKGVVNTVKGEMSSWAKKMFDEFGAMSLANYDASKGVEQWRSTVIRALKMEGQYSAANVTRTLYQMQTESGGNPRAINLWDSNAKAGIPSKGLMQVIDPTFKAYARAGFNKNIYDPLSNILASIRYAVSKYGSLANAYQGHGYANGGLVTKAGYIGEKNKPEMVIPLSQSKRKRGMSLWQETGEMFGMSAYTPENSVTTTNTSNEYNTYSPQFTLNMNGASATEDNKRKVKQWIKEAFDETFESMSRRNVPVQEV